MVEAPNEVSAELIRTRIRNVASRRNRLFLVATDDTRIIGMISLEEHELRALQHIRYMSLVVEPRYRRKGIGEELIRQALEWARETPHVQKIEVRVREGNKAGVELCQKFGFETEGRLKKHIILPNGRCLDDLVMALFVESPPADEKKA